MNADMMAPFASNLTSKRDGVIKRRRGTAGLRAGLVARGRVARGWLSLLRFDGQAQILLASLRGAPPAANPVPGALDVERAAVVALLVVVRVLVVVPKQRAPVRIVVVSHVGLLLWAPHDDRHRCRAKASGRFVD